MTATKKTKSATKWMVENETGKTWDVALRDELDMLRGAPAIAAHVGVRLGISHQTVYSWCKELGISVADYYSLQPGEALGGSCGDG